MELKGTRRTVPVVPGGSCPVNKKIRPLWPDFFGSRGFESRCKDGVSALPRCSALPQSQHHCAGAVPYLRCDVEEI